MLDKVPVGVQEAITELISHRAPACITNFTPISGGCINHGGKIASTTGDYFLKWNLNEKMQGMFEAEARGLVLLRATRAIDIPEVIGYGTAGTYQYLLLAFVNQLPGRGDFWTLLGQQLASLHRVKGPIGLDHNNFIGSLRQYNDPHDNWIDFFVHERLERQLKIAIDNHNAPSHWTSRFDLVIRNIRSILPDEQTSLLHGDLWLGNLLPNEMGAPCLIDPAVYYGHREVDLAMTRLFDTFDEGFYQAYQEAYPLLPGFEKRFDIYNLYPLLVHVNLFGSAYIPSVDRVLNAFS